MSTQPAGATPPRYQRNHDSTHTNEPHGSNDFNEITVSTHTNDSTKCALCDFVQIVVPSKTVETLESWRRSKKQKDPELSFQVRFRSPAGRLCLT